MTLSVLCRRCGRPTGACAYFAGGRGPYCAECFSKMVTEKPAKRGWLERLAAAIPWLRRR